MLMEDQFEQWRDFIESTRCGPRTSTSWTSLKTICAHRRLSYGTLRVSVAVSHGCWIRRPVRRGGMQLVGPLGTFLFGVPQLSGPSFDPNLKRFPLS